MKTEHRPQLLWTSHDNVSIHAKAIPAFNFSEKLRYQIDTSSLDGVRFNLHLNNRKGVASRCFC